LDRDREKLMYINQTMTTKRLVELSYKNEIGRQKARVVQEEEEAAERMKNLHRVESEVTHVKEKAKKSTSKGKITKRNNSKGKPVESRLY